MWTREEKIALMYRSRCGRVWYRPYPAARWQDVTGGAFSQAGYRRMLKRGGYCDLARMLCYREAEENAPILSDRANILPSWVHYAL